MLLAVLVLPMIGQDARMGELVVLGVTTLLFTVVISALFPVIGPFGTYGEGREAWFDDFLALRSGGPWAFDLPAMQGIIAMRHITRSWRCYSRSPFDAQAGSAGASSA
jgi:hypothetical protein